jgi:hypothetical protein
MKINKKLLPILLVLGFLFTPFISVLAYSGGLMDKLEVYHSSSLTAKDYLVNSVTDGNMANGPTLNSLFKYVWYEFSNPVNITGYQLKTGALATLEIRAIKVDGTDVLITSSPNIDGINTPITSVSNVKKIYLKNTTSNSFQINEFDVFGSAYAPPDTIPPANVTSLTATNITDKGFGITWIRPSDSDYSDAKIYLNGSYLANVGVGGTQAFDFTNLAANTTYNVRVSSVDVAGNESSGVTINIKTNPPPDVTPPSNVTNLTGTPTFKSVLLSWTNPPETDFAKVKVYEGGVYQRSVTASEGSTSLFDDLDPETLYTFKVTSVDNTGNESVGSSIQVTTLPLPIVKNIKGLDVDAKHDRVKLSWELPADEYFHHVNIYRKVVTKESFLQDLFSFGATTVYADDTSDGYTPMFETNGTYWTDLTVNPDTNYEYKLTSENTDGRESTGVKVAATTPQEPKPKIEGAAFTTSTNGDYVVTWEKPTKGSIKLFVGEEEYKTVQASQGSYTIPKADLKYTTLGDPDIKIQPITERGTTGDSMSNPKSNLPFSVKDLIESGNGLLWLISPFILLALAFLLVPKLRNLIVAAFRGNKDTRESNRRRFQVEKESKRNLKEESVQTSREPRQPKMPRIRAERIERETRATRETRQSTREPRRRRGS